MRRAAIFLFLLLFVVACDSSGPASVGRDADGPTGPHPRVAIGPSVDDGSSYTVSLLTGVTTLRLRSADLGGRLYRVETPAGEAAYPAVHVVGRTVQVLVRGGGTDDLSIEVDNSVGWTVRLEAGLTTATVDMRAGGLHAFSALGGVSTIDLSAGAPTGRVVLSEVAGVSTFAVHLPVATSVSVECQAGAGSVSIYGRSHSGVSAGSVLSGGTTASNRYLVRAQGGASAITVDASG